MIKVCLLLFWVLVTSVFAYADGFYVSDKEVHLYEPDQKAVISWDGKKETMMLSSAVKSDDIANFAWIVPIRSTIKPEVTAGDISIFEDLVSYFERKAIEQRRRRGVYSDALDEVGVEVVETKKIGVYDITILKATDSNALINWLNENGYRMPAEAKILLDKYIVGEVCFFITNKINLKNKFAKEIERIDAIYEALQNKYRALQVKISNIMNNFGIVDFNNEDNTDRQLMAISGYLNNKLKEEFTNEGISPNIDLELGVDLKVTGTLIIELYLEQGGLAYSYGGRGSHLLIKKIGMPEVINFNLNPSGFGNKAIGLGDNDDEISRIFNREGSGYRTFIRDRNNIDEFFSKRGECYSSFTDELNKRNKIVIDKIEPIILEMRELIGTSLVDLKKYGNLSSFGDIVTKVFGIAYAKKFRVIENHYNYDSNNIYYLRYLPLLVSSNDSGLFNEIDFEVINSYRKEYEELATTMFSLCEGIATPLKIDFFPPMPYYPLIISSLNQGQTAVDVYVIGSNLVYDRNKVLSFDDSIKVDLALSEKIKKHIDVPKMKYVTRLSYTGDSKGLVADAIFEQENWMHKITAMFKRMQSEVRLLLERF